MTEGGLPAPVAASAALAPAEAALAAALVEATKSPATRRKYRAAWEAFAAWAVARGVDPAPPVAPDLVLAYVLARAPEVSPPTLTVDLAALRAVHEARGVPLVAHPQLRAVLAGHRRSWSKPRRKAAALRRAPLVEVLEGIRGDDLRAVRDRALLAVGFAGALRRSELGAVRVGDLAFEPEGVRLTLPRSKTDQEGRGRVVGIPPARGTVCPVQALRAWLAVRQAADPGAWLWVRISKTGVPSEAGPRAAGGLTGEAIAAILRGRCEDVGLDAERISGHSLRRGWITEAAMAGADPRAIRRQAGHRDPRTTEGYIEDAEALAGVPRLL